MWWPENDEASGSSSPPPPPPPPARNTVPREVDESVPMTIRDGPFASQPHSETSGGDYSGPGMGDEPMEGFGDEDDAHFADDMESDDGDEDDADSFAGRGSPEVPKGGLLQDIPLGGDKSCEHRDTLSPLSGDIEAGGISGRAPLPSGRASAPDSSTEPAPGRRMSQGLDLATGKKGGGGREHYARIRSLSSGVPLSPVSRRNRAVAKFFRVPADEEKKTQELDRRKMFSEQKHEEVFKSSLHGRIMVSTRNWDASDAKAPSQHTSQHTSQHHMPFGGSQHNSSKESRVYEPGVGESLVQSEGRQYRLQAVSAKDRAEGTFWFNLLTCFGCGRTYNIYDDPNDASMSRSRWSTNAMVMRYLHWTFRSSLAAVVLSSVIAYFLVISLFAVGIFSIALRRPGCVGGVEVKPTIRSFSDCWQLSFATFCTCGYGIVITGTSATASNVHTCAGMTLLASLEAFYGMLFASICCAILFARIGRAQSYAQILFSDPIVIRFGRGASMDGGSEEFEPEDESSDDTSGEDSELIPCPVLEFRLANRMFGVVGGEIIDAAMNVIASIDANQACPSIRRAASFRRRTKKGRMTKKQACSTSKRRASKRTNSVPPLPEDRILNDVDPLFAGSREESGGSMRAADDADAAVTRFVEEDPSGNLVPRRIFAKLDVDPHDHPFFKRVWVVRHVLDMESPLLKAHARQMVCRNGGYWPRELNSYDGVRAAVSFDQILVSMTGMSNADANTVYSQKVYDFSDVSVGYRFVNMLYRHPADASLQVDLRLLNDVTEQAGGGGEPLDAFKVESKGNIVML